MSASRPYYDTPDPPDPLLDVVYDSVATLLDRQPGFRRGLTDVAGLVSRSLAGADGAGVALSEGTGVTMRVGSSPLVESADDVQYGLGEGPCLTAVAERRPIRTGSLDEQTTRWPRFADGVRTLGVGSVLSLPLIVRADVIGSINVYGRRDDAFREVDATNGERFALPVAAAIRSAQVTRHLNELAAQMHETLEVQALVSAAVGFLRYREDITSEAAQQLLSALAAERHQSMAEAAAALLEERDASAGPEPGTAP